MAALPELLIRNWAIVTIVLTTTILLVVPALVLGKYVRISLNIMRSTRPPLTRNPLDYTRLEGEPVCFPAFDGLRLAGMLIRPPAGVPRRGMVLFAHEFCSDMYSCARYCQALHQAGYDVFTFDFRGHGQSPCDPDYTPRQWVTNRDLNDMRGAIAFVDAWLEEQGLPRELGVVGVSRGACAAILAAQEFPQIRAIVSDGAFSTDTMIEYFMKRWAYIFATVRLMDNHPPAFWRFLRWTLMLLARREFRCSFPSVRKAVARMTPRPILFIHGEKDSYLPVEQTRGLYALAAQPKYLWIAPGAKHNQAAVRHRERYDQLIVEFFDRHLGRLSEIVPAPVPASAPQAAQVRSAHAVAGAT